MKSRVCVVSHACVLAANQSIYALLSDEYDITLTVPRSWRDALRPQVYGATRLETFHGEFLEIPVVGRGRPQRWVPLTAPSRIMHERDSEICLIEEEPFSVAAALWSAAARRERIAYAVQVAENLPRHLPAPVRASCQRVLAGANFVLARSPAALERAREWGYTGEHGVLGHGVAEVVANRSMRPDNVVGFVGRLVEEKGIGDLVSLLREQPHLRLRVAGDGPLRRDLSEFGDRVDMLGTQPPDAMAAFYDSVSVLAVPSRTTKRWSEQFGRIVVEAQARATPVVAYDSGELAWVAHETAAVIVPEGDVTALGRAVVAFATNSNVAASEGLRGRDAVERTFTDAVLAARLSEWISASLR